MNKLADSLNILLHLGAVVLGCSALIMTAFCCFKSPTIANDELSAIDPHCVSAFVLSVSCIESFTL